MNNTIDINNTLDINDYPITNKKDFYENGGKWVNRNCDELLWRGKNEVLHDSAMVWGLIEGIQIQYNENK